MSLTTLREESKKTVRRPVAKVVVTWTDPLIDLSLQADTSENNRISYPEQVADLVNDVPRKWAHTNDTDVLLDGSFFPMPSTLLEARKSQVGWWGTQNADASGDFFDPNKPTIKVDFTSRLVEGFTISGDNALNEYPVDFVVTVFVQSGGAYIPVEVMSVVGNTELTYSTRFLYPHFTASRIELVVSKWSAPGKVVKIVEFYSSIVETFESDDIMYMNILQEFESSEGTLPVGNISCNEMDISFQNITDRFFSENTNSNIHTLIKRNRKIEPFLGFRYSNDEEEYRPMGLYWSGDWAVNDNGTAAQTTARDRFELLRRTDFPWDTVFTDVLSNVGLKDLIITVLDSVTAYMYDFFYDISDIEDVYSVPHFNPEFFKGKTYFDVIKDLANSSLSYAYMDLPTEAEQAENGSLNKDILRMKKVETVFPTTSDDELAIDITKDDFIQKNQPADTESMANTINVTFKIFTQDPEDPTKWDNEEFLETSKDSDSIVEYGIMNYDYSSSDLIQTSELAIAIADSLLVSFKVPKRNVDMETYGDVTLNLADQISVPEYQKNGIDRRGIFAIAQLNSTYDGSLRVGVAARKLKDDKSEIVYKLLQDTDGVSRKIQNTDGSSIDYQDTGI